MCQALSDPTIQVKSLKKLFEEQFRILLTHIIIKSFMEQFGLEKKCTIKRATGLFLNAFP